jgi:ABC-2 type transport system permease protein
MRAVYLLTLRQMSGRWRLGVLTLLSSLPVLITALVLSFSNAPSAAEYETGVIGAMFAGAIVPLAVLALAAVAFANEVEDRTLANLVLAPLPRWKIVLPKLLATVTVAGPFVGGSAFLTGYIAYVGDMTSVLALTAGLLVAVALYGSAFTYLGLVTTQAIGIGLLYILVWEGLFSGLVSGVRMLSLRYYSLSVFHGLDPRRFPSTEMPPLWATLLLCTTLVCGFAWLSVRRLRRMDVP